MAQLQWHETGQRLYETGVDRGVLYLPGVPALPWNGLISVNEASSDLDSSINYLDGIKFRAQHNPDSYSATIEAFTYPDEFDEYGSFRTLVPQKSRKSFGFSYRTRIGNDLSGTNFSYKIHLIYNALAVPAQKDRKTLSGTVDPNTLSWDISTKPIAIDAARPSAHLVIDTTIAHPSAVEAIERQLYGTETTLSFLPQPNEVIEVFEQHAILRIRTYPDGTWTAEGPDSAIRMISDTEFEIDWPSVVYIDTDTYTISSL